MSGVICWPGSDLIPVKETGQATLIQPTHNCIQICNHVKADVLHDGVQ